MYLHLVQSWGVSCISITVIVYCCGEFWDGDFDEAIWAGENLEMQMLMKQYEQVRKHLWVKKEYIYAIWSGVNCVTRYTIIPGHSIWPSDSRSVMETSPLFVSSSDLTCNYISKLHIESPLEHHMKSAKKIGQSQSSSKMWESSIEKKLWVLYHRAVAGVLFILVWTVEFMSIR